MTVRRQFAGLKLAVFEPETVPGSFSFTHNGAIHELCASSAGSAGPRLQDEQWTTGRSCISVQAFENRFARAFECAWIAIKLKRPVSAQFKRVEFESELRGVDLFVELPRVLCFDDGVTQSRKPLLHDLCDAIAN